MREYQRLRDEDGGICRSCGNIVEGGCEPDAERYPCDSCGENQVFGIEQAVLIGFLDLDDEGAFDDELSD